MEEEKEDPNQGSAGDTGARRELVARHLDTLELMGEVRRGAEGRYGGVGEGAVDGEGRYPRVVQPV